MFNRSRGIHYTDLPKAEETPTLRDRADDATDAEEPSGTETDEITVSATEAADATDYIPADD